MKQLLFALVLSAAASAQTTTVAGRIEIPTAKVAEVRTLVEAWLATQVDVSANPEGTDIIETPRYRNVQHYLNSIFSEAVDNTLRQACNELPDDCPAFLKQHLDAMETAVDAGRSELDDTLQPGDETP